MYHNPFSLDENGTPESRVQHRHRRPGGTLCRGKDTAGTSHPKLSLLGPLLPVYVFPDSLASVRQPRHESDDDHREWTTDDRDNEMFFLSSIRPPSRSTPPTYVRRVSIRTPVKTPQNK